MAWIASFLYSAFLDRLPRPVGSEVWRDSIITAALFNPFNPNEAHLLNFAIDFSKDRTPPHE
jgi:hypothetical protein